MTTTDHKRIGIMYMVLTFVFFILGGVEALLMRLQLSQANNTLLDPKTYNELFTMHGTTMIFLFVVPIMAGFGNYFVPLMIGARDMAFPKLNALSFWLLVAGGLVFYASIFFNPPECGWTCYPPLSSKAYLPNGGVDAWIFLIHLTGLSSLVGAINFYATIANMRAPGMGWGRLPLFVWSILTYAILLIVALPVIAAAVTMLLTDRHFGTHFFDASNGGSPLLWQHLFWFFGHPEVYIMVLPGFGIISEVLPVFARKPIFGYKAIAAATVLIAFLGFLVWAHHMFATPSPTIVLVFFMLGSFLIAVPTGVKIFNWVATLWRGTIEFKTALLFCVGFIGTFLIGGITGIFLAVFPVDWQLTDTYFVVAHLHYVLMGGAVFGDLRGDLLLVPEDHRADAERGPRQAELLAHAHRLPRHLPDPALDRPGRHAAAHLRVRGRRPPRALQPDLDDRLVHPRHRRPGDRGQRAAQRQARADRRPGPVEGQHAGVVHDLAAAGQQLRRHPARALGRADEGHPPPGRAPDGADRGAAGPRGRVRGACLMAAPRAGAVALTPLAGARQVVADYVALTKPRVQSLLLFTTVTTMLVAGTPSLELILLTCLGGYLSAGGAGAVNHCYDRDIDARMARTADRPVPAGRVSPRAAPIFGFVLAALSLVELSLSVNPLAAALSFCGFVGYTLVYTVWLKRRTPQNIVIGGAAGAVPPLVGWAAVTGGLDGMAVYLFAIVFFWTPPHFWALSLLMKDEYERVGVPMLPVVRGEAETRRQILLYSVLLYAVTQLPFCAGGLGTIYLVASFVLGVLFIGGAWLLSRRADRRSALRLYLFSLAYLALLFGAMVADVKL